MRTTGQDPDKTNKEDNGPPPANNMEQLMNDEHAHIMDEIARQIGNRDIDSLSSLEALAESVFQNHNMRPRDEFCGLSADQIADLLHTPFDSVKVASFSDNFPHSPEAPAFSLAMMLVEACGGKGLKATAKGYLPALFCRETAIAYWGDETYKERSFGFEVRKEIDFGELHSVRLVCRMAGLIRKYHGRFLRTKKCEKFLSSSSNGKLYLALFTAYAQKFNWGYNDRYSDFYIIQQAVLFSLFLIHKFGNEFRYPTFYEEKFLQAFPAVLDEVSAMVYITMEEQVRRSYSLRTMIRFANFFGLIELESPLSSGIRQDYRLKKTPLLDQLIVFHV